MTKSGNQNTMYTMNDEWMDEWFNLPAYYTQVYMNPFSIGPILEKYIPQYVNMFPKLHIYVIYMYICMYNICNYYTVMNLFGFP